MEKRRFERKILKILKKKITEVLGEDTLLEAGTHELRIAKKDEPGRVLTLNLSNICDYIMVVATLPGAPCFFIVARDDEELESDINRFVARVEECFKDELVIPEEGGADSFATLPAARSGH